MAEMANATSPKTKVLYMRVWWNGIHEGLKIPWARLLWVQIPPPAPICSISLVGKASACQVEDRGFEPRMLLGHIGLPSRGVSVFTKNLNINKKGVD